MPTEEIKPATISFEPMETHLMNLEAVIAAGDFDKENNFTYDKERAYVHVKAILKVFLEQSSALRKARDAIRARLELSQFGSTAEDYQAVYLLELEAMKLLDEIST